MARVDYSKYDPLAAGVSSLGSSLFNAALKKRELGLENRKLGLEEAKFKESTGPQEVTPSIIALLRKYQPEMADVLQSRQADIATPEQKTQAASEALDKMGIGKEGAAFGTTTTQLPESEIQKQRDLLKAQMGKDLPSENFMGPTTPEQQQLQQQLQEKIKNIPTEQITSRGAYPDVTPDFSKISLHVPKSEYALYDDAIKTGRKTAADEILNPVLGQLIGKEANRVDPLTGQPYIPKTKSEANTMINGFIRPDVTGTGQTMSEQGRENNNFQTVTNNYRTQIQHRTEKYKEADLAMNKAAALLSTGQAGMGEIAQAMTVRAAMGVGNPSDKEWSHTTGDKKLLDLAKNVWSGAIDDKIAPEVLANKRQIVAIIKSATEAAKKREEDTLLRGYKAETSGYKYPHPSTDVEAMLGIVRDEAPTGGSGAKYKRPVTRPTGPGFMDKLSGFLNSALTSSSNPSQERIRKVKESRLNEINKRLGK